jgi:hypothetical protein
MMSKERTRSGRLADWPLANWPDMRGGAMTYHIPIEKYPRPTHQ